MFETVLIVAIGLAGGFAVGMQAQVAGDMGSRIGGAAGRITQPDVWKLS